MSFGCSNVKRSLLCAIAAMGVVSCVQAQQAGQPIIFSSPESTITPSSPSAETASKHQTIVDPVQVPSSIFNFNQSSAPLPPSTIRPPERKKNQQDPNSWVFMTPSEILGVNTPEKMMGIQDRDAAGNPVNLTPEERYAQRLNQAKSAYTNNYSSDNSLSWKIGDQNNQSVWDTPNSVNDNSGNSSGWLNQLSLPANNNSVWPDNRNDSSSWSKLSGSFKQVTDSRPQQNPVMEQFKELLNPTPAPTPASKPVASSFNSQQSFGFPQPVANPIGGSAAPVSSGIGLPSVLPTLPTITSQTPQPSLMPSWKIRMTQSQTPDFKIPERKF